MRLEAGGEVDGVPEAGVDGTLLGAGVPAIICPEAMPMPISISPSRATPAPG